jgi:hypothetical protein
MRDFGSVSKRFMETQKFLTKNLYSYHLTNNKLMPDRIIQLANVLLLPPQNLEILQTLKSQKVPHSLLLKPE